MWVSRDFQRIGGAVVWYVLVVVRWSHSTFVEPPVNWWLDTVLGAWEESCKAFLRESFATATRLLNGAAAWTVSLFFNRGYYDAMRSRNRRLSAWEAWWSDRAHSSTFNSMLERDGLLAPRPAPSPTLGRLRRRSGGATGGPLSPRQSRGGAAQKEKASQPRRWYQLWRRGSSAVEGASDSSDGGSYSAGGGGGMNSGGPPSRDGSRSRRGGMKRTGSELFERPSGYGIAESIRRRGLLEDTRLGLELAVTAVFEAMRTAVRAALFLPSQQAAGGEDGTGPRRQHGAGALGAGLSGANRPSATSRFEDLHVWTASDVILQAGYPLEEHIVTTGDGYVLQMQRIPRKGARDVAFFMHGLLDTSLGWVANGVLGSQAFAAWDAGHDVWLGNSRSNPPRAHVDPGRQGARYWCYSMNELGMEDVAAQVEHIHSVKTRELTSGGVWRSAALGDASSLAVPKEGLRRTASDSALLASRHLDLAAERSGAEGSPEAPALAPRQPARGSLDNSGSGRRGRPGLSIHLPPVSDFQDAQEETVVTARSAGSHGGPFRYFPFHPFKRRGPKKAGGQGEVVSGPAEQQCKAHANGPLNAGQHSQQAAQQVQAAGRPDASDAVPSGAGGEPPSEVGTPVQRLTSFALDLSSEDGSGVGDGQSWFDTAETPVWGGSSSRSSSSVRSSSDDNSSRSSAAAPSPARATHSSGGAGAPSGSGSEAWLGPASGELGVAPRAVSRMLSMPSGFGGHQTGGASHSSQHGSAGGAGPGRGRGMGDAVPGVDARLLTPDRVSVQGVEQPPGASPASPPLPPPAGGPPQAPNTYPRPQQPGGAAGAAGTRAGLPPPRLAAGALRRASMPASEPYRLRAVGHSLGAGSLLIYAVMCRVLGRPHRLKRMVLLTPAGFHVKHPKVFVPFMWVVPGIVRLMDWLRPGIGSPAYLPSSLLRYITFKLTMDLDHIPGLNELTRAGISLLLSGDKSQWDRALQMPHYNTYSMPAISFHVGDHLLQLMRVRRFQLYDYGSPAANQVRYGAARPPDVAASYSLLGGLPVDLVAGRHDGIIAAEDVLRHYEALKQAGVQVSYKEFGVGHLDVIFAVKDEIRHYVLSRLQLKEMLV